MMYRSLFVVAATGVASVAAFAVPPSAMPARASSLRLGGATAPRSARSASLGLEMARVPFIAGNWKMNPTSVAEVISGSLLTIPAGPGARCLLACDVQNASQGALITHFPLPPPPFPGTDPRGLSRTSPPHQHMLPINPNQFLTILIVYDFPR